MESISKQRHTSYVITEYEVYMSSAIDTTYWFLHEPTTDTT